MSDYDVKNQKKTSDTPDEQSDEPSKLKKTIRREEKSVKNYQFFALRLILILAVIWVLFFYRLDKDVQAQDLIVLEKEVPSLEGRHLFICRVVAVAGDTVEITEDNHLIINGNTVVEPNIFYSTSRYEGYTEYPLTLQEGECFVLADSRNGGTDSRFFGPVSREEIDGTVITIVRRNNL